MHFGAPALFSPLAQHHRYLSIDSTSSLRRHHHRASQHLDDTDDDTIAVCTLGALSADITDSSPYGDGSTLAESLNPPATASSHTRMRSRNNIATLSPPPLEFLRASQSPVMPYRLSTHVLTVDANVIHKVDTANPANLYSMWTGESPLSVPRHLAQQF